MTLGRVLLVDDDKNFIDLVKMRLESKDYKVTTALKEEEAIEAVKEQTFDVSLVDRMEFH
jgi:CheY-like chemotaxis protein